jgi:peptidoglycan/LPS O-acetylase OafA/YrhL
MVWLVVLGITYLLFNFPAYYYDNIPYLATYTFNYTRSFEGWEGNPLFTHLWSLSVEEQFYLFLPPLVFFLPVKWLKAFMVVMVVMAPVARYLIAAFHLSNGMHPEAAADAVYWNTLSHLDAFSLGGIIAVFSLHRKWKRPGLLLTIVLMIVMAAGALNFINAGTGFYFTDLGYRHNQTVHYEYVWHYSLLNLLFATVILYLTSIHVQQKNLLQKILGFNWLVRVGKVSYGMYIFHWAVLVYVFNKLVPPTSIWMKAVTFIPYSITVYLLAEVSFRLFETPFLKLKDVLFPSRPLQNNVKAEVAATPTAP